MKLVIMLVFTRLAIVPSTVDIRPVTLPGEVASLGIGSVKSDRNEFVLAGNNGAGNCTVAVLGRELQLLVIRSFPGGSCGLVEVDSSGDIMVTGFATTPGFLLTDGLGPLEGSGSQFLLKLSRASLDIQFSVRLRIGNTLAMAVAPDNTVWLGGFALQGLVTTPDAIQTSYPGLSIQGPRDRCGFLVRISSDGRRTLYSTYLGGLRDAVAAIRSDPAGNIYVAGSRIWKFSLAGALVWSTWVPPSSILGSAVGLNGDLYLVGTTGGEGFYVTPSAFQSSVFSGQSTYFVGASIAYPSTVVDGFVMRLSSAGEIVYSTLMGGVGYDYLTEIIVESDGSAFVRGYASGDLFPTYGAIAMRAASGSVLAKLSPDGSSVAFSSYLLESSGPIAPHPDGGLLMFVNRVNPPGKPTARRVTELPASLPRVDAVTRAATPRFGLLAGFNAIVSGEGLSAVTAVTLGPETVPIISQTDNSLEVRLPENLPFSDNRSYAGDLCLIVNDKPIRRVRILVGALVVLPNP